MRNGIVDIYMYFEEHGSISELVRIYLLFKNCDRNETDKIMYYT